MSSSSKLLNPDGAVPVADKLRLSLAEACELVGQTENYIRALERKCEFPPRVTCPPMIGTGPGSKSQFIAVEVHTWAADLDWRAMVERRLGSDWRGSRAS